MRHYNKTVRLWSIHPRYLDPKGLVALWREALLAKAVLRGLTKGYRSHPQLARFKAAADPLAAIDYYLAAVCEEAESRGYSFDRGKVDWTARPKLLRLTRGQLLYERSRLLGKLLARDPNAAGRLAATGEPDHHPLFLLVEGEVEDWEVGARRGP
jgi:hypothetical protein